MCYVSWIEIEYRTKGYLSWSFHMFPDSTKTRYLTAFDSIWQHLRAFDSTQEFHGKSGANPSMSRQGNSTCRGPCHILAQDASRLWRQSTDLFNLLVNIFFMFCLWMPSLSLSSHKESMHGGSLRALNGNLYGMVPPRLVVDDWVFKGGYTGNWTNRSTRIRISALAILEVNCITEPNKMPEMFDNASVVDMLIDTELNTFQRQQRVLFQQGNYRKGSERRKWMGVDGISEIAQPAD